MIGAAGHAIRLDRRIVRGKSRIDIAGAVSRFTNRKLDPGPRDACPVDGPLPMRHVDAFEHRALSQSGARNDGRRGQRGAAFQKLSAVSHGNRKVLKVDSEPVGGCFSVYHVRQTLRMVRQFDCNNSPTPFCNQMTKSEEMPDGGCK